MSSLAHDDERLAGKFAPPDCQAGKGCRRAAADAESDIQFQMSGDDRFRSIPGRRPRSGGAERADARLRAMLDRNSSGCR